MPKTSGQRELRESVPSVSKVWCPSSLTCNVRRKKMSILAFLMCGPDERSPMGALAGELPYAGVALILIGIAWAIGRAIIFRRQKKRTFYPYAAILLGILACVAGFVLEIVR